MANTGSRTAVQKAFEEFKNRMKDKKVEKTEKLTILKAMPVNALKRVIKRNYSSVITEEVKEGLKIAEEKGLQGKEKLDFLKELNIHIKNRSFALISSEENYNVSPMDIQLARRVRKRAASEAKKEAMTIVDTEIEKVTSQLNSAEQAKPLGEKKKTYLIKGVTQQNTGAVQKSVRSNLEAQKAAFLDRIKTLPPEEQVIVLKEQIRLLRNFPEPKINTGDFIMQDVLTRTAKNAQTTVIDEQVRELNSLMDRTRNEIERQRKEKQQNTPREEEIIAPMRLQPIEKQESDKPKPVADMLKNRLLTNRIMKSELQNFYGTTSYRELSEKLDRINNKMLLAMDKKRFSKGTIRDLRMLRQALEGEI